jgi:hypothetical protein
MFGDSDDLRPSFGIFGEEPPELLDVIGIGAPPARDAVGYALTRSA